MLAYLQKKLTNICQMYRGSVEPKPFVNPKSVGYYLEMTSKLDKKRYKLVNNCWQEDETGVLFKTYPDLFTLEAALNKRRELQRLDGIIEIFYETGK